MCTCEQGQSKKCLVGSLQDGTCINGVCLSPGGVIIGGNYVAAMYEIINTYTQQFHFLQEPSADRHESLFRPLVEPINARAVDDGRELPATHAQCGTDGREAEDYFEHASHAVDEELPDVFSRVLYTGAFTFITTSCKQKNHRMSQRFLHQVRDFI